jgi:hypothetical protein
VHELSVSDGFKFGCGFVLALLIAWLVIAIVGGILAAIFGGTLVGLMERFVNAMPLVFSLT